MDLQDATAQYVDMVKLGAHALQRLAERELKEPQTARLNELISALLDRAERIQEAVEHLL